MNSASVYWFTGLSGVGKSTIAVVAKSRLELMGLHVLILDGDIVRRELHRNLGFSESDIEENNRLISELCVKHRQEYDIILVPIISPFRRSRSAAKKKLGKGFYEIHLDADLNTLYKRDTKGLYKQARNGQIDNLIGVSKASRYEPPEHPDLRLDTVNYSKEESIKMFLQFIVSNIIKPSLRNNPI